MVCSGSSKRRQGGWFGLVGLLVALVIVALLGKTLLQQMGLLAGPPVPKAGERSAVSPAGGAPIDPTPAVPSATVPLERARGVESALQQQVQTMNQKAERESQ